MRYFKPFSFIVFVTALFFSCQKENFVIGSDIRLSFSADTIVFDTLFTEIGSATYYFKVYNNTNKTAKIDEIFLAKGNNSDYRVRIDGENGIYSKDVEIAPKDSMYIFIETTLIKNSLNTPQLVQDSLVFRSGSYSTDVDIISWGQNVTMIKSQNLKTVTWSNSLPYLIFGSVTVDTLETLTVEKGSKIYFHKDSKLSIKGGFKVKGTLYEPVLFTTDRLEAFYDDIPGQWDGIYLPNGNLGVDINYATIENCTNGLSVKKTLSGNDVKVNNSIIHYCLNNGIEVFSNNFNANNLLISDCGSSALLFGDGVNATLNHTTIANYYDYGRNNNAVVVSNSETENSNNIKFTNSIIWGSFNNEFSIEDNNIASTVDFDHCIIRQDLNKLSTVFTVINTINEDPLFFDLEKRYFYLKSESPAKDFGKHEFGLTFPIDLRGVNRIIDNKPDVGAYEFFEIP